MTDDTTETRSILLTAVSNEDRKMAKAEPLEILARRALDALAAQVANEEADTRAELNPTGTVPDVALEVDADDVDVLDLLASTFGVTRRTAGRQLSSGRVMVLRPTGWELLEEERVQADELRGTVLRYMRKLAMIRPQCTCTRGRAKPGSHNASCPVRTM